MLKKPLLDIRDPTQPDGLQAEWDALTVAAQKFQERWGWPVVVVSAPNEEQMPACIRRALAVYTSKKPDSLN